MAKTTYTGANVAPTTDTFSEWVDLTNRITYDMSDVVITVADVSQPSGTNHAETTGNGHVNGYFSSNYLVANTQLRGGTTSASANLIIGCNRKASLCFASSGRFYWVYGEHQAKCSGFIYAWEELVSL